MRESEGVRESERERGERTIKKQRGGSRRRDLFWEASLNLRSSTASDRELPNFSDVVPTIKSLSDMAGMYHIVPDTWERDAGRGGGEGGVSE